VPPWSTVLANVRDSVPIGFHVHGVPKGSQKVVVLKQEGRSAVSVCISRYAPIRMAYYLVRAKPRPGRLAELHRQLQENAFIDLRPFGKALTCSLTEARTQPDGTAVWEEEDYCSPPLAQERAAVLDKYLDEIKIEQVNAGEGWTWTKRLPKLNLNR
jgi:hypothetical protein